MHQVAVINLSEEIVAILKEGMYFGELALLATARRVATCASLTHCDLNVLNSHDLQSTMRDFPMSAAMVKAWAVSRLADLVSNGPSRCCVLMLICDRSAVLSTWSFAALTHVWFHRIL